MPPKLSLGSTTLTPKKPKPKPPLPRPVDPTNVGSYAPGSGNGPTPRPATNTTPKPPAGAGNGAGAGAGADDDDDKAALRADAMATLQLMLDQWGLGSLAGTVIGMIQKDYSVNQILVELRQSAAYKQRFSGNEERLKRGYAALEPAEYLAVEDAYQRIMESAGLPKGFWDDNSDFANLIGRNVSAAELQERVDIGVDAVNNSDPHYLSALRMAGFGDGDLIASVLDQERAMPILRRTVGIGKLGAAAMNYGLGWTKDRASQLYDAMAGADGSVDLNQAKQGYSAVASALPTADKLSRIYKGNDAVDQEVLEDEFLAGSQLASQRRGSLARRELMTFRGSGAAAKGSLTKKSRGEY